MGWRMAYSLETGRAELNAVFPGRDKTSDGGVGDISHSARDSKHNPGPDRIVEARDFDEDIDPRDVVRTTELWVMAHWIVKLAAEGHPAFAGSGAHVIYEGRIWSWNRRAEGWRPYTGVNAHKSHMHVATVDGKGKDSRKTWRLKDCFTPAVIKAVGPKQDRWLGITNPPMTGADVRNLHNALIKIAGTNKLKLVPDYLLKRYGRATSEVVQVYKTNRGISERGFGPECYRRLRSEIH